MALKRMAPWQGMLDMQRDLDLLTDRVFGSFGWPSLTTRRTWVPAVDVFHRENDLVIRAELPGIDPENDVEISLDQNVLTIRGERRYEERHSANGGSRFESGHGSFSRSVVLPEAVTEADIQATYEDGILEVVVPGVLEQTQPKRIPIGTGSGRKALTTKGQEKS